MDNEEFNSRQVTLSRYRRLLAATSDPAAVETLKALIAEVQAVDQKPANRPVLQAEQEQPNESQGPAPSGE